jgi:hypothetical protein
VRLLRATFLGVRGLPDLTWQLGDQATSTPFDVVVVTGPAASGKTRLLEALIAAKEVLAPSGPPASGAPFVRAGERHAKVELTFVLDEAERRAAGVDEPVQRAEALFRPGACASELDEGLASVLERYEHDPRFGKVEYLPARRALPLYGPAHGLSAAEQRTLRAGSDPRKYSFVPRLLLELPNDPDASARFGALVASLAPGLVYAPSKAAPLRAFSSRGGEPVTAHELSSCEADAVLVAATATLLRLERSIVLVDAPEHTVDEAHLADWALALRGSAGGAAAGLGPQLVLATKSRELVRRMDARAVIELA